MTWPEQQRSELRARGDVVDVLVGAVLVVPLLVGGSTASGGARVATAVVVLAGVAAGRRAPLLSLFASAGLSLPPFAAGFGSLGPWPLVAMVTLALLAGRRGVDVRPAVAVFTAVAAVGLLLTVHAGQGWSWLLMLLVEAAAVLAWWLGRSLRLRAQLTAAGWHRAARLEGERDRTAQEARQRERARIAQDMHDSLGHQLSLIALQAGALELNTDLDQAARGSAAQLRQTSASATDQLREVIGLLRDDAEQAPGEQGGDSIVELVDGARRAGASVALHSNGDPADLPATIDRAVYRVVQESLTNALKHAPGAAVTVRVSHSPQEAMVEVANPLPQHSSLAGEGAGRRGLLGLHERVRLAGGTLRAGPHDGAFCVVARLPRAAPQETAPVADHVPGWADPAQTFPQARRQMRRDLRRAAALPVALLVALALALLGARTYTTTSTALDPAEFARLQVGQPRIDVAQRLPAASMDQTLPVVPEPAVPRGAQCEYYRTTATPFTLSNDLFRLCFADGDLVSKDTLMEP